MRLYDETDSASIEAHGVKLREAGTLAEVECEIPIPEDTRERMIGTRNKSAFGMLLERSYYGINPGNSPLPDFPEAGVELKSHPLVKHTRKSFQAKERLALNMINYQSEAGKTFEESSFSKKNSKIMLVSFEHEDARPAIDHPVRITQLIEFDSLPEKDRLIIRNDWERIQAKIVAGKAHELSEGDTDYLSACTKSATSENRRSQAAGGPDAKPRAYSFKPGYMTALSLRILRPNAPELHEPVLKGKKIEELRTKTLEQLVEEQFAPYIGMDTDAIATMVGEGLNKKAKQYRAMLARRMLGIRGNRIEEFEKAGILMKTIHLTKDGKPKEAISFPAMSFQGVIHETWDGDPEEGQLRSELQTILERKFLFVVFKTEANGRVIFRRAFFWNMPAADIDAVQPVWEETIEKLAESDMSSVVRHTDDRIIHMRPHGKDMFDLDTLPNGEMFRKSCFWLNKNYIKKILDS
ncbi:MAG: hypothetical protein A2854_01315 [Parcubacteria group bacterium RIFCSPHIGHO2_01_FULL_56_18]|nr:MAG: hypothetical protein A2854_01315 [Parcubacteria group bacterium RIFCSPHIGHO2_01_FULL_56_18]